MLEKLFTDFFSHKTNTTNTPFTGQASVAHAYNPSYSGGKDQEDHSSKRVWANIL
jgi:hypothetical protein